MMPGQPAVLKHPIQGKANFPKPGRRQPNLVHRPIEVEAHEIKLLGCVDNLVHRITGRYKVVHQALALVWASMGLRGDHTEVAHVNGGRAVAGADREASFSAGEAGAGPNPDLTGTKLLDFICDV